MNMIFRELKHLLIILFFGLFFSETISGADWQWSVQVRNARDNKESSRAYLWIPPDCRQIKAIVFAQHNMEEISIFEMDVFRKSMSEMGIAEIWCAPRFDLMFHFNENASETLEGILADLSDVSGYNELKYVPVIYMGHSAAASAPYYYAASNPQKALAAVSVSGQWPYARGTFAPDIWGDKNIDYTPCLETMGEYEAANTWSVNGLKDRKNHPLTPLSMLACPAEGHFAATEKKASYIAFYIKKVMQYRLPQNVSMNEITPLKPIDPTQSGWLKEKWRMNSGPLTKAAPVNEYKGNPDEAFWFFDEEHVRKTEEYESSFRNLKPQLIGYVQNGKVLPQQNTHLQVNPKFIPEMDGITFRLSAAFYDTVPGGSPRLPNWSGLPVGSPVGHSKNGTLSIDKICGSFLKIGKDRFRIHFDKSAEIKNNKMEFVFAATHPGDREYKPAVQQASMIVPASNTEGMDQEIFFPAMKNIKSGTKNIKLKATSSSGMPVSFSILDGPAEISGNKLTLTKIPVRAKYPVKIRVIAWQYGRSIESKIKSAVPVERTIIIVQ